MLAHLKRGSYALSFENHRSDISPYALGQWWRFIRRNLKILLWNKMFCKMFCTFEYVDQMARGDDVIDPSIRSMFHCTRVPSVADSSEHLPGALELNVMESQVKTHWLQTSLCCWWIPGTHSTIHFVQKKQSSDNQDQMSNVYCPSSMMQFTSQEEREDPALQLVRNVSWCSSGLEGSLTPEQILILVRNWRL